MRTLVLGLALSATAWAQEKPPTDMSEQQYPWVLPNIRVSRPLQAEPGFDPMIGGAKSILQTRIAVGGRNVVHVVWQEYVVFYTTPLTESWRLYYAYSDHVPRRFNGFSEPQLLISGFSNSVPVRIQADRNNNVYLVWEDYPSVKAMKRIDGTWTASYLLREGAVAPTSYTAYTVPRLARYAGASADRIDLSYLKQTDPDTTDPTPAVATLEYQSDTFGTAPGTTEAVFTSGGGNSPLDPIAFDINPYVSPSQLGGTPAIAWTLSTTSGDVKMVSRKSGTWANYTWPENDITDMAAGPDDRLHVIFSVSGVIAYRRMTGAAIEGGEFPIPGASGNARIAVSLAGFPRVWISGERIAMRVGNQWKSRNGLSSDGLMGDTGEMVIARDGTTWFAPAIGEAAAVAPVYEPNLGEQDAFAMQGAGPVSVNAVNGNVYFALPLFASAGRGLSTSLSLVYNSHLPEWGTISRGWRHNYEIELTDHDIRPADARPGPQRISVLFGNGRRVVFTRAPSDAYYIGEDEFGHFSWISRSQEAGIENPTYVLQTKGGMLYNFNSSGRVVLIRDPQPGQGGVVNAMILAYYTDGRLQGISDSVSRGTQFSYTNGRLTAIVDPSGHVYTLFYDSNGFLSNVQLLATPLVVWGVAHDTVDGRLLGIITPKNAGTSNLHTLAYWPEGRFWKMTDPAGKIKSFLYNDDAFKTTITDRRGKQSTHDWRYRLSQVWKTTDALGNYIERTPTVFRGVSQHRDRNGHIITYGYDVYVGDPNKPPVWVKSNLQTVLRSGQTTPTVSNYNLRSNIVDQTDPLGNQTRYVYDATHINLVETHFPAPPGTPAGQEPIEYQTYDGFGRTLTITDPMGNVTTHEYGGVNGGSDSGTGLVTSVLRAGHTQRELFFWDVMGRLIEHRTPMGAVTITQYDAIGRVTQKTLPAVDTGLVPVITYTLDANGNIVQTSGPRSGEVMSCVFDAQNRLTQTTNPLLGVTTRQYNEEGHLIREDRPNGDWSTFTYDDGGRLIEEQHDASPSPTLVKTFTRDGNGNILTETLPPLPGGGAVVRSHQYDSRSNVTRTTHPDGSYDDMTYDANDRMLTRIRRSSNGVFHSGIKNTYDERGLLKTVTEIVNPVTMSGPTTTHFYNKAGKPEKVRSPLGQERRTEYDAALRPIRTFDPFNVQLSLVTYDDDDRKVEEWHQNPVTNDGTLVRLSQLTYTPAGYVKTMLSGWNGTAYTATLTNSYDLSGNRTRVVDEEGNVREWDYDLNDRMTHERVEIAPGIVRQIVRQYDTAGNVTSLTDARGKVYNYTYDKSNRVLSTTYPGTGATEQWTYTAHGWTATYTDENGTVTSFTYDANGRAVQEAPAGFPTIFRTFDAGGNLLSTEMGTIRAEMTYDVQNRLTQMAWFLSGAAWKSVSYGYDDNDRRTSMTDPEGAAYAYTYDNADRVTVVARAGVTEASLTYDSGHRRKTLTHGNGAGTTNLYDLKGRLVDMETKNTAGAVLSKFTYVYNKADQRTSATLAHHARRIEYVYNGAYEVRTEIHSDTATNTRLYYASFQYDAAGNRVAKQVPAGHSTYDYADDNRLLVETKYAPVLVPAASAAASDTEVGYTPTAAIDGVTADGTSSMEAWSSENTAVSHSLTASLATAANVAAARLWFPSGNLPQAFRVQISGSQIGTAIATYAVTGAIEVSPGVFRALQREVLFSFPAMAASSVTFIQNAGGGSAGAPNRAYLNELQILVTATSSVVVYSYNPSGDQTGRVEGTSSESWTYNAQHRIATYQRAVGGTTQATFSYGYDSAGRRLYKQNIATGHAQWFAYENDDVAADYAKPPGLPYVVETSYVNSLTVDSKLARVQGSAKAYYLSDVLGSNQRMLDTAQLVIRDELTNGYGEVVLSSGAPDRYGFTGREKDDESGLMHYRLRAYDPRVGRFVQRDPVAPALEHYVYGGNNPVMRVDPFGDKWTFDKFNNVGEAFAAIRDIEKYFGHHLIINPDGTITRGAKFGHQYAHDNDLKWFDGTAAANWNQSLQDFWVFLWNHNNWQYAGMREAHKAYSGLPNPYDIVIKTARECASAAVDFVPVASTIKSAVEAATGRDFIAGTEASRVAGAIGLVPFGKVFKRGGQAVKTVMGAADEGIGGVAGASRRAADATGDKAMAGLCFVAGTQVLTPEGARSIEEIRPGDLVLSRSDRSGEQGFKRVAQTFVTHPTRLYHLTYRAREHRVSPGGEKKEGASEDDDGPAELVGTGEHPFWRVDDRRWVPLKELRCGDRLSLADGREAVVEAIAVEDAPPGQCFSTYNFEVEEWHTYFVGERGRAPALAAWVHNTGENLCSAALPSTSTQGRVYDVGLAKDLRKTRVPNTEVNHTPASRQADSLIGDFNTKNKVGNEVAIRLPTTEHAAVTAAQAARTRTAASARELLADEIRILRQNANAPNSALRDIIRQGKELHPSDYAKLGD